MEKKCYRVTEISRSKIENYTMWATTQEIKAWCKMKRDAYGYINGVGGDRSYDCFAVLVNY